MSRARQRTLLRMRQLATKTATLSAISMQVLGCDPLNPPAREPPANKDTNTNDNDAGPQLAPQPTTVLGSGKPDGG